ncbi:cupredoxin domain-containing protein [Saccharopolyspora sp. NPDC002376]
MIALMAALCAGATTAAAAQPAQTGFGPPRVVPVGMVEFALLQPAWFPPGRYTFHAINEGRAVHVLEINGPGVNNAKTPVVQPGNAADLTVTLVPGVYDFWCPVGDHRQEGMQLYVRVG